MARTSLCKALNEAIQNNNDGVMLIELGCYREARTSLQKAVKQARGIARTMRKDRILPKPSRNIRYRWGQAAPLRLVATDSFVFRRALSIVPLEEIVELSNCRAESTTMLFNLGLTFHLEAASNTKERIRYSKLLERALECYRVAVSMRVKHRPDQQERRLSGEQLFDLGLANNIAEVHVFFMDDKKAASFYNEVSGSLHNIHHLLPSEDVTGLCLNIAAFNMPRAAAAA